MATTEVKGSALEMSADTFRGHLGDGGKLADVMFVYTQALMAKIAQSVVCKWRPRLQQAGLIHYQRGDVTITKRRALDEASCECYEIVKSEDASSMDGA
jgi:hypothetical protein